MKLTIEDYFAKMSRAEAPSQEVRDNALELLAKVNALLAEIPLEEAQSPRVNSGWRTVGHNAITPGAAPNSKHVTGQAIDLADPDGVLDEYLFARPQRLVDHGLYLEHPLATKSWCHLQSVPPRSGTRIFMP
jgi:hypothetical protein